MQIERSKQIKEQKAEQRNEPKPGSNRTKRKSDRHQQPRTLPAELPSGQPHDPKREIPIAARAVVFKESYQLQRTEPAQGSQCLDEPSFPRGPWVCHGAKARIWLGGAGGDFSKISRDIDK